MINFNEAIRQELCSSWLNCKSEDIEINTRLPYVAIYDFFAQGDEAEKVISEILEIYENHKSNPIPTQAAKIWYSYYF